MGCNCKKPQILNNTNSKDHLKLLFKVYDDVISKIPLSGFTEVEELRIKNVYKLLYPNVKYLATTEHLRNELIKLYNQKIDGKKTR
jgi:hypothetical protein